jgi:hypothetical protein
VSYFSAVKKQPTKLHVGNLGSKNNFCLVPGYGLAEVNIRNSAFLAFSQRT